MATCSAWTHWTGPSAGNSRLAEWSSARPASPSLASSSGPTTSSFTPWTSNPAAFFTKSKCLRGLMLFCWNLCVRQYFYRDFGGLVVFRSLNGHWMFQNSLNFDRWQSSDVVSRFFLPSSLGFESPHSVLTFDLYFQAHRSQYSAAQTCKRHLIESVKICPV